MSEQYDKIVKQVQRDIQKLFREAKSGIKDAVDQLLELFMPKVDIEDDSTKEEKKDDLLSGFVKLKKKDILAVTSLLYAVNKKAKGRINDAVPVAFAESLNMESCSIEQDEDDIGMIPFSEEDVEEWMEEDPDLFPVSDLDEKKDNKWNAKNLRNIITTGVLLNIAGKKLGNYVTNTILNRNKKAMDENAYTTISGAGEAGKNAAIIEAESKGAELEKVWIATFDFRTRDSHRAVSGQRIPPDGVFANGLRFPRDPEGSAAEVCNCRCSMSYVPKGWKFTERRENLRTPTPEGGWVKKLVPQQTYQEWYDAKVEELGEVEIKRQVNEIKKEYRRNTERNRKKKLREQQKEGA